MFSKLRIVSGDKVEILILRLFELSSIKVEEEL